MNTPKPTPVGDRPAFPCPPADTGLTVRQLAELTIAAQIAGAAAMPGSRLNGGNTLIARTVADQAEALADELLRRWELHDYGRKNGRRIADAQRGGTGGAA